ncbi:MAG: TolC family protein [Burkholderiaceae bacterium]
MFRALRAHARVRLLTAGALFFISPASWSQPQLAPSAPLSLAAAFETAWALQPPAASRVSRLDAALAAQRAAASWTAGPPTAGLTARTDRVGSNAGEREYDIGISAPLWLPGERERAARLADTQLSAVDVRLAAARLRLSAALRDAWWSWQRAEAEHALAVDRLESARRLNTDVLKRHRAGEVSRADLFQAEGTVAQAEVALADAASGRASARQALAALVGMRLDVTAQQAPVRSEPEPVDATPSLALEETHPALAELAVLSEQSRRVADLAASQRRANPEVVVATVAARGASGESYSNSIVLGVRVPFGAGPRAQARIASARADADELSAQLGLERARVLADIEGSRSRLQAVREQLVAAERRASLAREVRGFFERSFRLGESDLPTRLRVELEAVEAERQATRARVAVATAVSALRQALGLLPE